MTWGYSALALAVVISGMVLWFRRLVKKADEGVISQEQVDYLNRINAMEDRRDAELKDAIDKFKSHNRL